MLLQRVNNKHYIVQMDEDDDPCDILKRKAGWVCPEHIPHYPKMQCEHIQLVNLSIMMRNITHADVTVLPAILNDCPFCHSLSVRKHSIRHNKSGDVQRYLCLDCKKKFSHPESRHDHKIIIDVLRMHFAGETYKKIENKLLELCATKINKSTASEWVQKYILTMQGFLSELEPIIPKDNWISIEKTWGLNKFYLRACNEPAFAFSLLDAETITAIAITMWKKNEEDPVIEPKTIKAKNKMEFEMNQTTIRYV